MTASASSLLLFLLLPLITDASSHNWTDTSKLFIHFPVDLYNATGIPHVRGEFGNYVLTKSITARVYYTERTLCQPMTNLTEGFPFTGKNRHSPHVLLVHGGECSVVTKARHAQMAGAAGILIGEMHCTCQDEHCKSIFTNDTCSDHQNPMIDDGSGQDIFIPTVLVLRPTYEDLKERLKKENQTMVMELQWGLQSILDQGTKPSVHFWHLPHDPNVHLDTYLEMQRTIHAFESYIDFEPRVLLTDGAALGCPGTNQCPDLCTNGGRYCAWRRGDQVTPHPMVEEALRRLCIWDHTKDAKRYWEYVVFHKQSCVGDHYGDSKCIENAFKHSELHKDTSKIEECMEASGKLIDDIPNKLLEVALGHQRRSGVYAFPALSVNHKQIPIHARDLLEAVCNEYWYSNVPQVPKICETCGACANTVGCLEKGKCVDFSNAQRHPEKASSTNTHHHRGWKAFWWLTALSVLAIGGYYAYDKYGYMLVRERTTRRSGLLNDYMHLQSDG